MMRGCRIDQLATLEALLFWAAKKRPPFREPCFFWCPEEDLNLHLLT
jgi:hypothetical protein